MHATPLGPGTRSATRHPLCAQASALRPGPCIRGQLPGAIGTFCSAAVEDFRSLRSSALFLGLVPSYFISISKPEFTSSVADGPIYF